MTAWTGWLEVAAPIIGVGLVSLFGRPTWPRALGSATITSVAAMALSIWQGGLMIGGPRDSFDTLATHPTGGDIAAMTLWVIAYAILVGAVATGVLRATVWRR